jgi:Flp pilus assembly protein TadG
VGKQGALRTRRPGSPRHGRRDSGALILSYIIIVPVFMLAVMVIIQGALWYLARDAALAAARQGADAARLPGAVTGAGTQAALGFAQDSASGYLLGAQATASGSTPTTVQITVCGHVPTFVPGMVISVSQAVQAPVEQFTVPGAAAQQPGAGSANPATDGSAVTSARCAG